MEETRQIFFGKGSITRDRSDFQKRIVSRQLIDVGHKGSITSRKRPLEKLARNLAAARIHGRRNEKSLKKAHNDLELDSLTGLLNRRAMITRIVDAIYKGKKMNSKFFILAVDLDKFKGVNDNIGHNAGDQLLIKVGSLIDGISRDAVARWGGDEFVVLVESQNENLPNILTERIKDAFHNERQSDPLFSEIEASVGCAWYDGKEDVKASELFQRADDAMTHSKLIPGTQVTQWNPEMKRVVVPQSIR